MNIQLKCKYCDSTNEYPLKWVQANQRVFCPCCCKSYEVLIQVGFDQAIEEADKTVITEIENTSEITEELVNKDVETEDNQWDFYDGLPF